MRVIISAGGTMGHINPALCIIEKIKKEDNKSEILYIGTTNRMEKDIIPEKGIPYLGVDIEGLRRSLTPRNLLVAFKYLKAMNKCKRKLKSLILI